MLDDSVDKTRVRVPKPYVQQEQQAMAGALYEDLVMRDEKVNPSVLNVAPTTPGTNPQTACNLQIEVVGNGSESFHCKRRYYAYAFPNGHSTSVLGTCPCCCSLPFLYA